MTIDSIEDAGSDVGCCEIEIPLVAAVVAAVLGPVTPALLLDKTGVDTCSCEVLAGGCEEMLRPASEVATVGAVVAVVGLPEVNEFTASVRETEGDDKATLADADADADMLSPPLSLEVGADCVFALLDGSLEPVEAAVFCTSGVTTEGLVAGEDAPDDGLLIVLLRPMLRPPLLLAVAAAVLVAAATLRPPALEVGVRKADI